MIVRPRRMTGVSGQLSRRVLVSLEKFRFHVDLAQHRSTHGQKSNCGGSQSLAAGAGPEPCPVRQPKEHTMRFLGYTLADPSVPIPPPSPEMYTKMGSFI